MKTSELIRELQERIELYGDSEMMFYDSEGIEDFDINSVYYDDKTERIMVSNLIDMFRDSDTEKPQPASRS